MNPVTARTPHAALTRTVLGVVLSVTCLVIVVVNVDLTRAWLTVTSASWSLMLATALAITLDIGIRTRRWQVLLGPIRALSFGSVLGPTLIGCLANNVLPARLGEVARSVALGRRESISGTTVLGTVIVERILDTVVLAMLAAGAVAVLGVHGVVADAVVIGLALALGLGALLAGCLVVGLRPRGGSMHARITGSIRVRRFAARLHRGLAVAAVPHTVMHGIFLSVVAWGVGTGAFWLAAAAAGVTLSAPQAILLTATVSLASAIPSGPGYLGSFELAAITVLALFGVAPDQALAVAILVHATILLVGSTGGALALARSGLAGPLLGVRVHVHTPDPDGLGVAVLPQPRAETLVGDPI